MRYKASDIYDIFQLKNCFRIVSFLTKMFLLIIIITEVNIDNYNLTAAGEWIHTVFPQHKLNLAIHVLVIDGFTLFKIDTTADL